MTLVKLNNPINKTLDVFMNDFLNEFPNKFGNPVSEEVFRFPPTNIVEKNDAYLVELVAPGLEKADFNIQLEGKILTISAEKKAETVTENEKMIRKEFSQKSFKRSFTIDEKIEAGNITARYENGILKLELPKKEEVKKITKEITIQ